MIIELPEVKIRVSRVIENNIASKPLMVITRVSGRVRRLSDSVVSTAASLSTVPSYGTE